MAIELMARIMGQPRDCLDASEKWVLTVMADRADQDGLLWYAVETIADKTSFTEKAVRNIINRLVSKGFVRKMHRTNRSNYYIINVDKLPSTQPLKRSKESGPAEFMAALDPAEPDLFATGEPSSGTGERRSATGEPGSATGEARSPNSLTDSLSDSLSDSPAGGDPDDYLVETVFSSWNALAETFDKLPSVNFFSDQRRAAILRRADEFGGRFPGTKDDKRMAVWRHALTVVSRSKLLTGQKTDWACSFDWVTKKANFLKIVEENYGRGDDAIGATGPKPGERSAAAAGSEAGRAVKRARERGRSHAVHS